MATTTTTTMANVELDQKVFVGNIPPTSFTSNDLRRFFSKFGDVVDAFVLRDGKTNVGRRCGIVTFKSAETAEEVKDAKCPKALKGT